MIPILTVEQMRAVDGKAITELGIPSLVLMENAGRGCVTKILEHFKLSKDGYVVVVCGPGNNGGDGAVIARWFNILGYNTLIILTDSEKASPDQKHNLELCEKLKIKTMSIPEKESELKFYLDNAALIVDAIYGTGFQAMMPDHVIQLVERINESRTPVCSVDIPSGIHGDNGLTGICVEAELTLAMETYKPGHFFGRAKLYCGKLDRVPIGINETMYEDISHTWLANYEDLPSDGRFATAYKSMYGRVVIIGGREGYTGASLLATKAALRTGAGYVYVYHRKELASLYASRLTEALYVSVPEDDEGLPEAQQLTELWKDASVILIGPGLGRDPWALRILNIVLEQHATPLVIDADALNLISENRDMLPLLDRYELVITPHWGEFCRLADINMDDLDNDPIGKLRSFMPESPVTILLKSHFSLIRHEEDVFITNSGNDGLATGGSGDVLAGIVASRIAQNEHMALSAIAGSLILGRAAEQLATKRGTASILPSDVVEEILVHPRKES